MKKILSSGEIVCLSCGNGQDGVLVSTDDRPDLEGEICLICGDGMPKDSGLLCPTCNYRCTCAACDGDCKTTDESSELSGVCQKCANGHKPERTINDVKRELEETNK